MTNSENMGTGVPEEGKEPVGAQAQPASASSSGQPIENYQTVDEQLDAQSATGQLQDMIHSDGFHPERYDDPEVEIAAISTPAMPTMDQSIGILSRSAAISTSGSS